METFYIKQRDRLPAIAATLNDADGNAVDISAATAVWFHLAAAAGSDPLVSAAATNLDDGTEANRGRVQYDWQDGDTDVAGAFAAEFEVVSVGLSETYPNDGHIRVVVTRQVGSPT